MKYLFLLMCFFVFYIDSFGQNEKRWFDFWVGKWEVTLEEAGGKVGRGTNTITKTLDSVVIEENFKALEGSMKGYLGTSISVYNPKTNTWHQGYADNQGAYFNFIGERDGEKRIFKTEPVKRNDKVVIQRMVFYNITNDSMKWDWESSSDGGSSWTLNWRISYRRLE